MITFWVSQQFFFLKKHTLLVDLKDAFNKILGISQVSLPELAFILDQNWAQLECWGLAYLSPVSTSKYEILGQDLVSKMVQS